MTLATFVADWTSYYLNYYSTNIKLSTGKFLKDEYDSMQRKLSLDNKDTESANATRALRKKLYGKISLEESPFEIQQEWIRSKLNIPPHIWIEYSNELKGKTIAVEIVKDHLESLEDFYREMDGK